jgi:hypothetical protein
MSNVDPNRRPSNAGRYLALLILGLAIGVVATVMALRALDARKDKFPHALMEVQGWHMAQLKGAMDSNRCAATDVLPHLQGLRVSANHVDAAFPGLREDQRFAKASADLRAALDKSLASPPLNCAGVGAAMAEIGGTCKACHQDFRG